MKPCGHETPDPSCPRCTLYDSDPTFREMWGGEPLPKPAPKAAAMACKHRGEEGETVQCPTCSGTVKLKTWGCAVHGTCHQSHKELPGVKACHGCADRQSPYFVAEAGQTRHLLYYVYPKRVDGGAAWRRNVANLRKRLSLFNGKRVVAISTDDSTDVAAAVQRELPDVDHVFLKNNPDLRETAAFGHLFSAVKDCTGPGDATLFAHAKGVSNFTWGPASTIPFWTDSLYETLMDYWPVAQKVLRDYPLAGSFRRTGHGWAAHESASDWHYSGSWFWFRNADLFRREWWLADLFYCGAETYPSMHFREHEAGVVFHPFGMAEGLGLYRPDYWHGVVMPALQAFRAEHARERTVYVADVRAGEPREALAGA